MDYKSLITTYKSPLYIYNYDVIAEHCRQIATFAEILQTSLNRPLSISMHYSTKANYNPYLLKIVRNAGLKVDCMSPLEVKVNELAGFTPAEMLYVCNNVTPEEMEFIHSTTILPCLDSISQVESWGKLFPNTEIMIRINPGIIGVGHSEKVITSGKATKFGISESNIPELLEVCNRHHLTIIGTHQHLGSLFLNDKIDNYIAGVEAGLAISGKYFPNLKIIDLGGGFGVTALKHENGTYWIGTDIGMNALVRPSMYDSYHHISILSSNKEQITANICGNICESGDILGKQRLVTKPSVGDLVIIDNAGAYGYSMSSNYTGRVRGAEVLVSPDKVTLIRKRESIEDILKNIPTPE